MNADRFRTKLQEERQRVQHALAFVEDEGAGTQRDLVDNERAAADNHMADAASHTLDRELDDTLAENAEHVIERIDAALRRIDDGTYGTCERCGREIPEERLDARPWASFCVDCQRLEDHAA